VNDSELRELKSPRPSPFMLTYYNIVRMVFHMKTTLTLNDAIMKALKKEAAASDRTMSELMETALRMLLQQRRQPVELEELPVFDGGRARVDISNREVLSEFMDAN